MAAIASCEYERDADINAEDNEGNTPLAIALQEDHAEIAEFLRKHGAGRTR